MLARAYLLPLAPLFLGLAPAATAQDDIRPIYLRFGNHRTIHRDPIPGQTQGPYTQDHWKDNTVPCDGDATDPANPTNPNNPGDNHFPVAYYPQDLMKVERVEFCNAVPDPDIWDINQSQVNGVGSDGSIFWGQAQQEGDIVFAENIFAIGFLADKARFFDEYEITWEIRYYNLLLGGFTTDPAGTTSNRIYVSYDDVTPLFESLIHTSCSAVDGAQIASPGQETSAFQQIWQEKFVPLSLNRKPIDGDNKPDGETLVYWGPDATSAPVGFSVAELLGNGWGKCGAWGGMLYYACLLQGIEVQVGAVVPQLGDTVLLVQNATSTLVCRGMSHPIPTTSIGNQAGLPAQGNPNPTLEHKTFLNHCVCRFEGVLYDPSYGFQTPSALTYEAANLWGVGRALSGCVGQGVYYRRDVPGVLDLGWPAGW
ncbi:MAG: hypothetical protein AAF682_19780 [Planctomycetota bacterium]